MGRLRSSRIQRCGGSLRPTVLSQLDGAHMIRLSVFSERALPRCHTIPRNAGLSFAFVRRQWLLQSLLVWGFDGFAFPFPCIR